MKHSIKISILMVIAIISNSNLFATVRTWTGTTSTAWSTTTNWSTGVVPGTSDTVVIPGSLTNYPIISSSLTLRRVVVSGNLTVASSRTLTVSGSLQVNSGTTTITGSLTTVNLTISGGTVITGSNSSFTVSGYLLLNSGTLNLSSVNSVAIKDADFNGGTFSIDGNRSSNLGTGNVVVNGATINNSSSSNTLQFNSSGTFEFISGTINANNQTLDIRGKYSYSGGTFSNLNLLSVGVYNFDYSGTFVLNYKLRIRDTLNFINGKIQSTGFNKVFFNYNAYANGANNDKHIVGPATKAINSSNTTPAFTFPIGDGTFYAPVTISNYGTRNTGDSFTAEYFNYVNSNTNNSFGSGLTVVSKEEHWNITRTSSNSSILTTATVSLSYNTSRSGSISDATLLKVARWDGTQWVDLGRSSSSSSNNTNGTVITNSNVSTFTTFTIGSSSLINALPVHLLNFKTIARENDIEVKWSTTSEINNDYFSVEKSLDGKNWSAIGQVKGAGNTDVLTNYNFLDANPSNGVQYYRLKQVDVNGQFTYSNIAPVNFSNTAIAQLNIFPVPAASSINIELPGASEMTVTIFNANGQKVYENNSGAFLNIDIQNFEAGLYMVEVKADNQVINSKFIKY